MNWFLILSSLAFFIPQIVAAEPIVLERPRSVNHQLVESAYKEKTLQGLSVKLVCEKSTIAPGEPFRVGLHIQHKKGFHTYWKHPGLVGLATSFQWKLPAGFSASEIRWPYPELSDMAGHPCYGYERDVTPFVIITPPKTISEKQVSLALTASWMCCASDCFPGFKTLTTTLPVATTSVSNPADATLLQKAVMEVPKAQPGWSAKVLSKPGAPEILVEITPPAGQEIRPAKTDVYLFSSDGQVDSEQAQQLAVHAKGSWQLKLRRCEFSPKGKNKLPFILKVADSYLPLTAKYVE